jgi:hypothetical protein
VCNEQISLMWFLGFTDASTPQDFFPEVFEQTHAGSTPRGIWHIVQQKTEQQSAFLLVRLEQQILLWRSPNLQLWGSARWTTAELNSQQSTPRG